MLRSWRFWVLIVLLVGPFVAYIGLGFLWLAERGWLVTTLASLVWIGTGGALYILGARWTKSTRAILPPIDWNSPSTFAPTDRKAWQVVQDEAEKADAIAITALTGADLYINTGRHLANQLARHYHPMAEDPIDSVPVLELITALELAAEDLTGLVRQVPGGDLITPGHWKTAIQAAGYLQKANTIYSYLLPLINPATGIPRLASQHLMIRPGWKSMQENLLRWFYQAYVNRLGVHLIELYSGRLVIGADQYRRLTKKIIGREASTPSVEAGPLVVAVAGSRDSGHRRLVETLRSARAGDKESDRGPLVLARLKGLKVPAEVLDRLVGADWVEVHGYTSKPDRESARDRSTRRHAVTEATEADLLLLIVDDADGTLAADAAFAADWDRWFLEHPSLERPPAVAALLTTDRSRLDAARAVLPPVFGDVIAVDPKLKAEPIELAAALLPTVAAQLPRAERISILRHLQRLSQRSKTGRLLRQVGQQGKSLWQNLRRGKGEPVGEPEDAAKS